MKQPPLEIARPAPDELRSALEREQLRMLLAHTESATFAATFFAILIAIGMHGGLIASVPKWAIVGWIAAKVAVVIPRVVLARLARPEALADRDAPGRPRAEGQTVTRSPISAFAARCTVPLLALDGLIWGLGAAALMGRSVEVWALTAACVTGVACIATFGLQVRPAATLAYALPMIVPVSISLLASGGRGRDIVAAGLLLLLFPLIKTAHGSSRTLAKLVEQRLITEKALANAAEALELANSAGRAKDRFLAIVSHEFRTPLHGILGLAKLTLQDLPKMAQTALADYRLRHILHASQHLERMVNDLLDASFMQSGRLQLRSERFDLVYEVGVITASYAALAPESGLQFRVNFHPDLGRFVTGDSVRLAQVLHNLLGNAWKFTPFGGSVTLRIERVPERSFERGVERLIDSGEVRFSVVDTGPGVPPEEREMIFEIFQQGELPAGARPSGVGLGLAIARKLSRAMGGDVVCQSGPGNSGASFVFTAHLPVPEEPEVDEPIRSHRVGGESAPQWEPGATGRPSLVEQMSPVAAPAVAARCSAYAGTTVFVADDSESSLLLHATTVRTIGCDVEEFSNGAELLAQYIRGPRPNAILIDWDMPVMNGQATTLAIRQYEARNGLSEAPIIGLSAAAATNVAALGLESGMTVFLTKPCAPETIASTITSLIVRRRRSDEVESATVDRSTS